MVHDFNKNRFPSENPSGFFMASRLRVIIPYTGERPMLPMVVFSPMVCVSLASSIFLVMKIPEI